MSAIESTGDTGLFAGTSWHYARYRPGYPPEVLDDLVRRTGLDGAGRLLDLGCGTGQLTIPLARHVLEAVGVDPEPEMLAEAARQASAAAVTNVTWRRGSSADLPVDLGGFRVVTMGRSFHWMDRAQVLADLDGRVVDGGSVVIANDSCLVRPTTAWQRAIDGVQRRFLPPDQQERPTPPADPRHRHEHVLAESAFSRVHRRVYEFPRPWTLEQAMGYLYSTSLPLRRLLGDRRAEFEEAVAAELLAIEPSGQFVEPVALEVLTATRG
ncbi:class I SAM-dependent methyltransferase [Nocardia sp. NPDC055321]